MKPTFLVSILRFMTETGVMVCGSPGLVIARVATAVLLVMSARADFAGSQTNGAVAKAEQIALFASESCSIAPARKLYTLLIWSTLVLNAAVVAQVPSVRSMPCHVMLVVMPRASIRDVLVIGVER